MVVMMSQEFQEALAKLPFFEGFVPPIVLDRGRKFQFPGGSPRKIPCYGIEEAIASAHLLDEGFLPPEWEYLIDWECYGTYAVGFFEGKVGTDPTFVLATQFSGNVVTDPSLVRYGLLGESYIAKLLPGAIVKSRSQVEKEEEEEYKKKKQEQIGSAQRYLDWKVQSIGETIVLVSPAGETVEIVARHEVWDYGDRSRSWLSIGGLSL